MAIKLPPSLPPSRAGLPKPQRPAQPGRPRLPNRQRPGGPRVGPKGVQPQEGDELDFERESESLLPQLVQEVQRLNRKPSGQWGQDDYDRLEQFVQQLLEDTEDEAAVQHAQNPYAKQQASETLKRQLRMLLASLQPPPEMLDLFEKLWRKVRGIPDFDKSDFARQTLMNQRVRRDVMNRQVEEAVDEADRAAAERRVEALGEETEEKKEKKDDGSEPQGDSSPPTPVTLKQTLRTMRKKRRDLSRDDAEEVAERALDTMRALRDLIAPRWVPETQPWLLQTADTHVFQTVLAVIPEDLFKETAAYQGIQNLRSGEHAFTLRAADKILDAAARGPAQRSPG